MSRVAIAWCACAAGLAACGGGGDAAPAPFVPLPVPTPVAPTVTVSAATPYSATCGGPAAGGTLYLNAEVEPYVAINPADPMNLVAVWQQDRWSNGGAQGLVTGYSFDGGQTWSRTTVPFSLCSGGTVYSRASDPWVTFSPSGAVFQIALVFSGEVRQAGSSSAMWVSRSGTGGASWEAPISLTTGQEGASVFNDKEAITADRNNASFVYAVWDELDSSTHGSTWFSRTTDGGATWNATPTQVYDPGNPNQTLGNQIVVLPRGDVLLFFTEIDGIGSGHSSASFQMLRSLDHGATWPLAARTTVIAQELAVGARDPDTGAMIRDAAALPEVAVSAAGDLYVAFQDARFSSGQRDGILLTVSHDAGLTWSAPVQLNGAPGVQAFVPSITVRSDGMIGVTYYDLRHNSPDRNTLPTDYWLAVSTDGLRWSDSFITLFDMDLAPDALGLFVGDYQGLIARGDAFVPVFVQTNSGTANRTDVYTAAITPMTVVTKAAGQLRPMLAGEPVVPPEFQRRVAENLEHLVGDERQPRARASRRRAR